MAFWRSHPFKSLLALSSSVLPLLVAPPALAQPHSTLTFSDTGNHWAAGCIEGIGNEGLMKGYPDGRFQPNGTMTRAEFAAVMVKAFPDAPVVRGEPRFSDVPPDFWGWSAIKAAYSRGFLAGYPGNLFKPAQSISRAQAMIVIAKTQAQLAPPAASAADAAVLSRYFKDAQTIPLYARPGIAAATRSGIVVNYPDTNQLRPNDNITRGEATALLCRLSEDGSDARYYVNTPYIAAFGDSFDLDGVPKASEPSEITFLETPELEINNSFFSRQMKVGNQLFFTDESDEVTDLWQTDGTAAGTQLVRSLDNNGDRTISTDAARFIGISEERVWLLTYPYKAPNAKRAALWSSDRTASQTQEAKDFSPALAEALSQATDVHAGRYVTKALDERIPLFIETEQETQLWMTDGKSNAGTQQIATFSTGFRNNNAYPSQRFATTDSYLFFIAAAQANITDPESSALWRTDGTPEGTIPLQSTGEVDHREAIFTWKNQVYFTATTPETGKELWVSDGTERGTRLLKDIYPGSDSSEASVIGITETELFILANSSEGQELWATTGTPASTRLVKLISSPAQNIERSILYPSNGRKLFFNTSGTSSAELWSTDGTDLGTRPFLSSNFYSNEAVTFKDQLFFSAQASDGTELLVSDGAIRGTYQLADLTPGEVMTESRCARPIAGDPNSGGCTPRTYTANSTSPRSLTVLGDDIYFVASGSRLFRTDGTTRGTELIEAFDGGDRLIGGLIKLDERILFVTHGDRTKLWSISTRQAPLRNGFNRHTSPDVFTIDYPQSWYVKSSEREAVSIWNQQPSRQPSFPPGFAKTEVYIREMAFEDIVQSPLSEGRAEERGGYDSGDIVGSEEMTVGGRDALRVFLKGGENGEDTITTLIRYSDTQTATVTSFFTSGETENISNILKMHQSFKVD